MREDPYSQPYDRMLPLESRSVRRVVQGEDECVTDALCDKSVVVLLNCEVGLLCRVPIEPRNMYAGALLLSTLILNCPHKPIVRLKRSSISLELYVDERTLEFGSM